jgi:protein-tyrosine phosphatase
VIDTHCHLLPGLDDGPPDTPAAIALAAALADQGVTQVVCTPHFSRRYPVDRAAARAALERLRPQLERERIPLELHLGAEATPERVLEEPDEELQARSIAGRFLLVEVVGSTALATLELVQHRLAPLDLVAVFGHPERCRTVQRRPEALRALRDEGALVQVVAPSLIGRWGLETSGAALELIDAGLVDLLASDAHGAERRRPHLLAAAEMVARRWGDEVRATMTERMPAHLLEGGGRENTVTIRFANPDLP